MKSVHRVALLAICFSLAACSGGSGNSRIEYEASKTLPPLEVPPGLGQPIDTGTDNIPEMNAPGADAKGEDGKREVLPRSADIKIARDGSTRWLVIDRSADKLWPRLRQFWESIGLEVKVDEPGAGIMETNWAENRADTPDGFFARMVKKVFSSAYSAATRDKYRLRLEPLGDGRTELFVTHYGVKEVVPESQTGEALESVWEVRPSDPELANEVLNRLVLFLGGSKQTAKAVLKDQARETAPRAHIDGDRVVVDESFSRTWRLTGLALDRIGMVVEDRNRSEGIYYVSHVDLLKDAGVEKKEGWFSSMFSSDEGKKTAQEKQWQIHLSGDDNTTRIRVYDAQGNPLSEENSMPLLKRLQESLK